MDIGQLVIPLQILPLPKAHLIWGCSMAFCPPPFKSCRVRTTASMVPAAAASSRLSSVEWKYRPVMQTIQQMAPTHHSELDLQELNIRQNKARCTLE